MDRRGSETFVFESEENPYAGEEKTPAHSVFVQQKEDAERLRFALHADVMKYFSDLPQTLSLPAGHELARLSEQEISHYEEKYRFLDAQLKALLQKHVPELRLPSFDALMEDAVRGGGLASSLRETMRKQCVNLLSPYVFFETVNHLALFASFADTLGNAMYLQKNRHKAA